MNTTMYILQRNKKQDNTYNNKKIQYFFIENKYLTVFTISVGTDRPEQSV